MQFSPNGILGEPLPRVMAQLLPQEWHRPIDSKVAPGIGRGFHEISQQSDPLVGPECRATDSIAISQSCYFSLLPEAVDPVVDALAANLKESSQLAYGFPLIYFEDRQQATTQPGIAGAVQLSP
jgi:hypothetical protein